MPLLTLGDPAAFSLLTAASVSLAIADRKPWRAFLPSAALLIFDKSKALVRLWTSFSNGPTAWQIDFTYAAELVPLDPPQETSVAEIASTPKTAATFLPSMALTLQQTMAARPEAQSNPAAKAISA